MDKEYTTELGAHDSIASGITDFYAVEYPEVLATRSADIEKAIATVQEVFFAEYLPRDESPLGCLS